MVLSVIQTFNEKCTQTEKNLEKKSQAFPNIEHVTTKCT